MRFVSNRDSDHRHVCFLGALLARHGIGVHRTCAALDHFLVRDRKAFQGGLGQMQGNVLVQLQADFQRAGAQKQGQLFMKVADGGSISNGMALRFASRLFAPG